LGSLHSGPSALERTTTGEDLERELQERISEFEQWGGVHFAADVVGTALALGLESHPGVQEAATQLLTSSSPSTRALADRVLSGFQAPATEDSPRAEVDRQALQPWLSKQKKIVRTQPRNSLAWADLALAYTVIGQADSAEHAIRVALVQANGNRFVLRAAARFYIHREDIEKAHDLLIADTDRLREDPWLLASEIAIADSSGRPQRYATQGRRLLEMGFAPHDVSELASALATIELKHGRVKLARKLLSQALLDPTDNSLAQAEWSIPRGINIANTNEFDPPRNYEARARYYYRNEQFSEAFDFGSLWLADQPFALDPAMFTSYVASTLLDDQRSAIRACTIGLRASPSDPILLNNLAFSLATSGHLEEAQKVLRRPMGKLSTEHDAMITATRGLVAFRSGDVAFGRQLYRIAIDALMKDRKQVVAASAAFFWIYEELHAETDNVPQALKCAESASRGVTDNPDLVLSRRRVERLMQRIAPSSAPLLP
jgi:Flp pilus assembly protein TadD